MALRGTEGPLGMAVAPSESPQPLSLPASSPPASPTRHLQPLHPAARMIFQKRTSQHGLSPPGEKWCWLPAAFRKNRPGAATWRGEWEAARTSLGSAPCTSLVYVPAAHSPSAGREHPVFLCPPIIQHLMSACYFSDPATFLGGDFRAYPSLVSLYSLTPFSLQPIFHK